MEKCIEKLQTELGRQLKDDEIKFVEWLHKRMEQEEAEKEALCKRRMVGKDNQLVLE